MEYVQRFTSMTRALITGGAGFVGRHLTKKLLDKHWEVYVVDSLVEGSGAINPDNPWPLFDPRDYSNFEFIYNDCREYFRNNPQKDFDYVFHLAAVVGGRITIENNPLSVATDLAIDSDMWTWARANSCKVVNFSSSAAYPIHLQNDFSRQLLLSEEMISFDARLGMPDLTYGWAKLTSEYLGRIAWEKHGIKNVVYRPFSGYGPDQDLSYPFPSICKRAIDKIGEDKFQVWGPGTQTRDFIHIDDCVDGVIATMDLIDDGSALNLSTGIGTNFLKFAEVATDLLGYCPEIVGDVSKPVGVQSRVGDIEKQKKLGFTPKFTLQKGIEECLNYFQDATFNH